jgi:hypothetical protein
VGSALLGPERTDRVGLQAAGAFRGVGWGGGRGRLSGGAAAGGPHTALAGSMASAVGSVGVGGSGVGGVWLFFEKCIVDASIWFVLWCIYLSFCVFAFRRGVMVVGFVCCVSV